MLVNCVAYEEGRKLGDIAKKDISEYLKRPGCFVWVALQDATSAELEEMQEEFELPELAVDDAHIGHRRPKIEEYGDTLFAVVQTIEPEGDDLNVGEVDIFVGKNYVLSVRMRSKSGFADVRERTEREPDLLRHGAAYVFYALLDKVVDRYFPLLDALESELERLEEDIFARNASLSIQALYDLKRKLMTLKHAVDPLMESVGKLYEGRVPHILAGMGEYFRDVYDHLQRVHSALEGIREMLGTAIQVNLSMISMNETEVTKKLAAWAARIAVPTLIAGVYGMNFKHMPELDWVWGYPAAVLVMISVDVWLFVRFRKIKWL